VINQIEGPIITLRDGRDQVKFPPTCGNPTTFRAKLGERPLQSVMNFGNAAGAVIRHEPGISVKFSKVVVPDTGSVWEFFGSRDSGAVVQPST
jgi:hypothetical protein